MSLPKVESKKMGELQNMRLQDRLDNPLDYLSIDYNCYLNKIYGLSITEPSKYYVLRNTLTQDLNIKILQHFHRLVFDLLRYGQIDEVSYTEGNLVSYPSEKVNQIAMSFSVLIKAELDKIISLILPPDNNSLATNSLRTKHMSGMVDTGNPIAAAAAPIVL